MTFFAGLAAAVAGFGIVTSIHAQPVPAAYAPPPKLDDEKLKRVIAPSEGVLPDDFAKLLPRKSVKRQWYQAPRRSDTVIVFVHGIFSNNVDCWTYVDPVSGAPSVFWPRLIREDTVFDEVSTYLAGFYTAPASGKYEAGMISGDLYDALTFRDPGNGRRVLDFRNIIFVAHSTGGIVVRDLLARNASAFATRNVGLVLMASPSLGSAWADKLAPITRLFGNQLADELRTDSEFLKTVDQNFRRLLRDKTIPNLVGIERAENYNIVREFWCPINSCEWVPTLLPPIVEAESAGAYFGDYRILGGTTHFSAVKPDGLDHPGHEALRQFFQRNFSGKVTKLPFEAPVSATAKVAVKTPVYKWQSAATQILEIALRPGQCTDLDVMSMTTDQIARYSGDCKVELRLDGVNMPPGVVDQRLNLIDATAKCVGNGDVCNRVKAAYDARVIPYARQSDGAIVGAVMIVSVRGSELGAGLVNASGQQEAAWVQIRIQLNQSVFADLKVVESNHQLAFGKELRIPVDRNAYAEVTGQVLHRSFSVDTKSGRDVKNSVVSLAKADDGTYVLKLVDPPDL